VVLSPTGSIKLGFTTWGNLADVLIITLLLGFSNKFSGVNYTPANNKQAFLALLPGRKKISARGVSHVQSFTLLLFCFILFLLASFYKKFQKLVPL
jgi:hypothetical protein